MGSIITRSEAVFRLKTVIGDLNNAIHEIQASGWKEGSEYTQEALSKLEHCAPLIDDAAENIPPLPQPDFDAPPARTGGMGYRGSFHSYRLPGASEVQPDGVTPPPPLPRSAPASSAPTHRVLVTPPPPIPIVKKPPVAPPPPPKPVPPPESITVTFDPKRMTGQMEYLTACLQAMRDRTPTPPSLTDEEWQAVEIFDRLDPAQQAEILARCRESGQPVTIHFNPDLTIRRAEQ